MIAKVSIIIPTWNRADIITKAIKSAQTQTHKNIEIIICDDGSTDNTEKIVKKLQIKDKRIIYTKNKHSGLPAVTRNNGLKIAKGNWIAFLDDDDLWDKNKLTVQLKTAKKENCGMVCSNAVSSKAKKEMVRIGKNKYIDTKELFKNNSVVCSSVLVKRKILEKTGWFSENRRLRAIEDYNLWLKISTFVKIFFINKNLVLYNDDPNNSIRMNSITAKRQKTIIMFFHRKWLMKNKFKKLLPLNQ